MAFIIALGGVTFAESFGRRLAKWTRDDHHLFRRDSPRWEFPSQCPFERFSLQAFAPTPEPLYEVLTPPQETFVVGGESDGEVNSAH